MSSVAAFIVFSVQTSKTGGASLWPALLGALVGGIVSLSTTLLVEGQRNRAAEAKLARAALSDARLAARVIALELTDAESVLRVGLSRTPFRWPPSDGYEFPTRAWLEYSARLGAAVDDQLWNEVALPYSSFQYANLWGTLNSAGGTTLLNEIEAARAAIDAWEPAARSEVT